MVVYGSSGSCWRLVCDGGRVSLVSSLGLVLLEENKAVLESFLEILCACILCILCEQLSRVLACCKPRI